MKPMELNKQAEARTDLTTVKSDYRPAILGSIFSLTMFLQVIGQGSSFSIQASSILALFAIAAITFSYPPTNKLHFIPLALIACLSLLVVLGAIQATHYFGVSAFVRSTGVLLFLSLGLLLARRKEHHLLERTFPVYAVTFVAVLIYVLIDNDRHWDRLRGHLHSNLWAYIAATTVVGIWFARIPNVVKLLLIFFCIYMIAMEFQARGSLIWATLTLMLFANYYIIKALKSTRQSNLLLAIYAFTVVLIYIVAMIGSEAILADILMIHSATRGLGTGLSGRIDIWAEFLNLFWQKPLFGHGSDVSRYIAENYLSGIVAGDISSAHNSYITILFDFGFIGFLIYVSLILLMILGVVKSKRSELAPFIMVFLLLGLTESRPLNVGNPSAFLFVLLIPSCAASAFDTARKDIQKSAGKTHTS
jgi:O-antigen ligase